VKGCLLSVCLLLSALVSAQSVPSIAKLGIGLAPEQKLPLGETISLEIPSYKASSLLAKLEAWQGIQVSLIDPERLLVKMQERPRFTGQPNENYLTESFVIDFDEDSMQEFLSGFAAVESQVLNLSALEQYVAAYISNPTYEVGFNIASVIATERRGDCTEHAVLLTALARSMNLHARVIVGSLIVGEIDKVQAFGHAWVEVWYENQWHILDAAMYGSKALRHFYLPASPLLLSLIHI